VTRNSYEVNRLKSAIDTALKGLGWRAIAKQLGVGVGKLYRVTPGRSKIREEVFGTQ